MGSSEIWDKYHECYIGNGNKFHEAEPSEICHFQYNKSQYISNTSITVHQAIYNTSITSTNKTAMDMNVHYEEMPFPIQEQIHFQYIYY